MKSFIFAAFLFAAMCLSAQTFDVASIRINRSGTAGGEGRTNESIATAPGSLTMKNVTLRSCLKWAYGVKDFQISNAPGWFATERYDIVAKAGTPANDAELRTMLRVLLNERFHLTLREEQKQLPVYALVPAKSGPKLKPATAANEPPSMRPGDGAMDFKNVSMPDLADRLAVRPYNLDRPVVDKTGLTGAFDFSLKFADNAAELKSAMEDMDRGRGPSVFTLIQQQLGLKLDPQTSSLPSLTIQQAEKIPAEN